MSGDRLIDEFGYRKSSWGGGFVGCVLPFLFVLTIVVFFHELGHFLVARWCGVRVLMFSVGFGPEIVGFNDRHGTRWKLSAIPLGGYVKFFGDENAASVPDQAATAGMTENEKRESFHHQKVASRAAIVAAGPIANFILAIVIFTAMFMVYGKQSTTARVDSIQAESAAASRGLQARRRRCRHQWPQDHKLSRTCSGSSASAPVRRSMSTVDRGGNRVVLKATPALREIKDNFGNVHRLGVLGISRSDAPDEVRTEKVGPVDALVLGADKTWFVVEQTMSYLGGMIAGRESADQLGGPIRIAQVSGQVATVGFWRRSSISRRYCPSRSGS